MSKIFKKAIKTTSISDKKSTCFIISYLKCFCDSLKVVDTENIEIELLKKFLRCVLDEIKIINSKLKSSLNNIEILSETANFNTLTALLKQSFDGMEIIYPLLEFLLYNQKKIFSIVYDLKNKKEKKDDKDFEFILKNLPIYYMNDLIGIIQKLFIFQKDSHNVLKAHYVKLKIKESEKKELNKFYDKLDEYVTQQDLNTNFPFKKRKESFLFHGSLELEKEENVVFLKLYDDELWIATLAKDDKIVSSKNYSLQDIDKIIANQSIKK